MNQATRPASPDVLQREQNRVTWLKIRERCRGAQRSHRGPDCLISHCKDDAVDWGFTLLAFEQTEALTPVLFFKITACIRTVLDYRNLIKIEERVPGYPHHPAPPALIIL